MIVMFLAWKLVKRTRFVRSEVMDLRTDRYDGGMDDGCVPGEDGVQGEKGVWGWAKRVGQWLFF